MASARKIHLVCTKHINEECARPAVELLLIADGRGLTAHARCAQHRAADDAPILRPIMLLSNFLVCPLPADGVEDL